MPIKFDPNEVSPAPPAVGNGQTAEEVLAELYRLALDRQVAVLELAVPRILGRLQEVRREEFLDALRLVPHAEAKLDEGSSDYAPAKSSEEVVADLLNQPFEAQFHILHLAAPRVVSALDRSERERLLDALDRAVYGVARGVYEGPSL